MPDLLTAADVAAALGLTPSRVRALARSRGVGRRVGRDWLFGASDLERLRERTPGRPVGWRKAHPAR
jgi:hypothetical protein